MSLGRVCKNYYPRLSLSTRMSQILARIHDNLVNRLGACYPRMLSEELPYPNFIFEYPGGHLQNCVPRKITSKGSESHLDFSSAAAVHPPT